MEMPPGPPVPGESPTALEPYADADVEPAPDAEDERGRLLADEAANRRLVATTAAFALVAVAIMIGVFLLTHDPSSSPAVESPPTAPAVTIPTATTVELAPDVDQAELDAVIDRVEDFVATERGLDFEDGVEVVVLGRGEYEDRVRQSFDATVDERDDYLALHASVYQALGIWPPGTDPVSVNRELGALSSIGFYDVDAQQVVMGIGELSPLFETTLAHELTHALDDQHFGIDRPALYRHSDEVAAAFDAVSEGDARRVELAYTATLSEADRATIADDTAAATPDFDQDAVPAVLLFEQQFSHNDGQVFVQALLDDGGNDAVDRAFRHPPTTSEEVLEPDTYLEGLPPTAVPRPEPDGDAIAEGVIGQSTLNLITAFERPEDEDVPEWNGDHYVLWTNEAGQFCVRFQVDGDTAGYGEQLQNWATEVDAEVATVDDALMVTVCN